MKHEQYSLVVRVVSSLRHLKSVCVGARLEICSSTSSELPAHDQDHCQGKDDLVDSHTKIAVK